ncbi:beta-ketoacyl synthase N-terminal-like domain-containing protein [Actinokineospora globicatena]|uniref:beta-ketoacyl synthase N-terminal-like domain-containing protein n=1 Tax=Actinokineospora globicatena TaxID=103729 RepID=UPI0020A43A89|nr:beta-ketoacyl synthase N-terminal-like domain-containing protein [Actinokineospora globicatena]MCP2306551.1 3-oxoacyl-[acyl-carrier-protein] synthase II [Actinokineospora globicatena]GLW81982.1 3-oxoacyl-[acyl-carrier-protein] synthase 2 [Actinokineospora globicatena]GLW88776.1 3-oxoacyl-[acyl-carrier-protein] synthase 2 [Actinokineospora globicatena]
MADRPVLITAVAARTAFGRDGTRLRAEGFAGVPAFGPVTRFDTEGRRTRHAATLPGAPALVDELVGVINEVYTGPGSTVPLLLAVHADAGNQALAAEVAARTGVLGVSRVYTGACVAATSAVADAATMIATGRAERVLVAAGYLVEPSTFALFDAGRALARDGRVRPFSAGRQGMLLGDGVAAVLLESSGSNPVARLVGWSRAGDAYHVCKPRPDGKGLARAIAGALDRADLSTSDIGYVNANGTGTEFNDAAEVAALRLAGLDRVPVSSTKSVHGHALEASGLVELVATVQALNSGALPVNSGYLGADPACDLDLVVDVPRRAHIEYALTVNAAFGGANTALLVGAA